MVPSSIKIPYFKGAKRANEFTGASYQMIDSGVWIYLDNLEVD